jgi:hypothetical protein
MSENFLLNKSNFMAQKPIEPAGKLLPFFGKKLHVIFRFFNHTIFSH